MSEHLLDANHWGYVHECTSAVKSSFDASLHIHVRRAGKDISREAVARLSDLGVSPLRVFRDFSNVRVHFVVHQLEVRMYARPIGATSRDYVAYP